MNPTAFFISWAISIALGVLIGHRKDRMQTAVVLAVILGWIGVVIALFLKPSENMKVLREIEKQDIAAKAIQVRGFEN